MIICDTFVFLHLHKSGGTFVNHMMVKCIPSAQRVGYHLPYAELPEAFRHLPVIGTVRNPWSYYVSWYHFQQGQAKPNPLFRICSDDGALDFAGTIRNLVTLESDDGRIDRLAEAFPDHFVNYGLNLTRQCIETIRSSGVGFYTFLHDRLYAGAPSPRILRMEGLREQLSALSLGLGASETIQVGKFLKSMPMLNVSEHRPYQEYYPADLQALIGQMDRPLIDTYGYVF